MLIRVNCYLELDGSSLQSKYDVFNTDTSDWRYCVQESVK